MTGLPAAYRRLQIAAFVDNVGDGVSAAAVPLLAVTLTHDPRLVSLVSAAATLPWLLLSLPAGALVDRYDRAGVMWRAQAVQAVVAGALAVAVAVGVVSIPLLAVAALTLGGCEVFFGNAAQAILPELVPAAELHRANGQRFAATATARTFVDPPVGSLLKLGPHVLPIPGTGSIDHLTQNVAVTLPDEHASDTPVTADAAGVVS